jgi:hypothetical protein
LTQVHNVRLNLFRLLLTVIDRSGPDFRSKVIEPILADSKDEKDPDVSYILELIKDRLSAN